MSSPNNQLHFDDMDTDSIDESLSDNKTTHLSKFLNYCIRCRLLGIACDRRVPQCHACKQASVDCLIYPAMVSDRLFNLVPQRSTLGNTVTQTQMHMYPPKWTRTSAGKDIISEEPGESIIPDDIHSITENPLRNQSGHNRLEQLQAGPLEAAILNFPIESRNLNPDLDSEQSPLQTPLPSSDLLDCISRTIAQAEASRSSPPQSPLLNESLGGSSLLALGVLLQEYTKHLL
ncbi:hypothetical protein LPJ73_004957 [Coemansia sp. RSA 2703]|nr:hypothetical protein LPJ73_004957 [Coemansia sp. RSA 2703]